MKTCVSILEKLNREDFKYYKELELDKYTYGSFIDADFEWACDSCLKEMKAILAGPRLQVTPYFPHLAYYDTHINCQECRKDYVFRKQEKKVWYESYKLPTTAQPTTCLECRRKNRQHNSQNKTVSEILRKSDNDITDEELEIVVDIFTSWDKMDKAKYYQSVLTLRQKKERNTTANTR